jgi:glycine oxidase
MRVTVVGGGVIGLSIAWRAAAAGLDVRVVDPEHGRGASWVAAGMLAPVTEVHFGEEAMLALNLASAEAWPAFADELAEASHLDPGHRRCGTLAVARDTDDLAALEHLRQYQEGLGLDTERLRSRECRRLEPALAPGVRGGVLVRSDHQVDNRRLVAALLAACRRAGVELRAARAATIDGTTVVLDDGDVVVGDVTVLTAGAWSGLPGLLPEGRALPVRPVKGQVLRLRAVDGRPLLDRVVRGLEAYLVPRSGGELVVGATMEERGFDTTVTAGAVAELLRAAIELVPAIDDLELAEAIAGLRPGTPDNAPLIGSTAIDGIVAAAGHHRNGILLTPVTATAIVELLRSGSLPEVAAPFSPLRFSEVPA